MDRGVFLLILLIIHQRSRPSAHLIYLGVLHIYSSTNKRLRTFIFLRIQFTIHLHSIKRQIIKTQIPISSPVHHTTFNFTKPQNIKSNRQMAELKVGDSFPEGVKFSYVPYTEEKGDITSCGIPITYDASKEFAGKKVVLFSVPGAFTPGCSAKHLPGYIENLPALKGKGVDIVAVIAFNDAWVMSAWGKANGIKGDDILFLSDSDTAFSKKLGWTMGERTARYALVIDNGKIVYAEKEPGREVSVSSAEAVLAKL